MRKLTRLLGVTALGLFALGAAAQDRPGGKKGAPKLEGNYTVVAGEEGGKPIPADRIKGSIIRFTKDRITGTDKDRKEFFAADYKLDTTQKPWRIKMKSTEPKESETTGLIKRDGPNVVIIYALPGRTEPKEFKTAEGQQMFTLKPAPGKPRPEDAVKKDR